MTRHEIRLAAWAGVAPTLAEWQGLAPEIQAAWADEVAQIRRGEILSLVTAMQGRAEAEDVAVALLGRQARVDRAILDACRAEAG